MFSRWLTFVRILLNPERYAKAERAAIESVFHKRRVRQEQLLQKVRLDKLSGGAGRSLEWLQYSWRRRGTAMSVVVAEHDDCVCVCVWLLCRWRPPQTSCK